MAIIIFSSQNMIVNSFLVALTILFCLIEGVQYFYDSKSYWKDGWNYLDIFRVFITFVYFFVHYFIVDIPDIFTWLIMGSNLVRGISAFRIFKSIRYYIRLISLSLEETKYFLILFVYSVLAFGILNISVGDAQLSFNEIFILPFTFTAGVIDANQEISTIKGLSTIIAITINIIVMLNMIISILGDCFDEFQYKADIFNYREMASVIYENKCIKEFFSSEVTYENYLHICIDASEDPTSNWKGKILDMRDCVNEMKFSIRKQLLKIENDIKERDSEMQKQIEEIHLKVLENEENTKKSLKYIVDLLEKMQAK